MHWKSRPRWLLLLLVFVFLEKRFFAEIPYVAGANSDYSKECDHLTCKIGEQCVSRKFWCDHSPCPTMTYCSKSKKDPYKFLESLKGPETCESVICTIGYKCQVRVRDCDWNDNCKQRSARCISERELEESPASSCAAVACPLGHSCVLRETHCHRPPCKLTRTCAQTEAVQAWFEECKRMGCRSEHDCFLRRPPENCAAPPCHHVPDCIALTYSASEDEQQYCRGWICPTKQVCAARVEAPCKQRDNCPVARSCQPANTSRGSQQPIDILSPRTTLTDLEREDFLAEQRRLRNYLRPMSTSNFTKFMMRPAFDGISPSDDDYGENAAATGKTKRVTELPTGGASSLAGDSPWLTYLKRKAGAEAVQYWIEKARNNEGYEEFVEWLESVAGLLDADTYRLWLRELQLASLDVPEFQSWISPRNLAAHRSHRPGPNGLRSFHADSMALASGAFPGSIVGGGGGGGQAKNHLDAQPSQNGGLVFYGSGGPANPLADNRYGRQGFMEKQTESSPTSPAHLRSSNFNFNEPRGFDGFRRVLPPTIGPPSLSPTSLSYLDIGNRAADHGPSPSREFEDSVGGSSWNSWPSYYQLDPASSLLSGFPSPSQMPYTTVYLSNYSRSYGNFDVQEQAVSRPQHTKISSTTEQPEQPTTRVQVTERPDQSDGSNRVSRPPHSKPIYPIGRHNNDEKANDMWDERPQISGPRHGVPSSKQDWQDNQPRDEPGQRGQLSTDKLAPIRSMVDKLSGFHQLSQLKPNLVKLDPRLGSSKANVDTEMHYDLPNLLIYFPPPFNFFIYYSGNDTDNNNRTIESAAPSTEQPVSENNEKPPENKPCNGTDTNEEEPSDRRNGEDCHQKPKKINKHKEFDYIRKIIMQLLEYWDKEEKLLEHSNESDANNELMDLQVEEDFKPKDYDKTRSIPSFDSFLDWLRKHAKNNPNFLKEKLRKKGLKSEHKVHDFDDTYKDSDHSSYDNLRNAVPKKMRILVDVDKNPEMMKALLAKSKASHSNKTNSHEYQVIVNLKDLVDPTDEGTISRRLMNIATNQLHKNLTDDKKMPKTLWVFPIYEEEDNETVINELEKIKNKKIKSSEELNTPAKLIQNYNKYRPNMRTETDDDVPQFVTRHRPEDYSQLHHQKDEYNEKDDVDDESRTNENDADYEDDDPNNESQDESNSEKD